SRRRHTRFKCDWSSDVCSSDLITGTEMLMRLVDLDFRPALPPAQTLFAHTLCTNRRLAEQVPIGALLQIEEAAPATQIICLTKQIGRASCRERAESEVRVVCKN